MNEHAKKAIAPVVVVICVTAYYFGVAAIVMRFALPAGIKILAAVFSLLITAVCIAMLIERIKEIKKGETDDIGKY
jgi:small neutral amino acid transporter SnatA (MarC family)